MVDLGINFRVAVSAQKKTPVKEQVKQGMGGFARYIVRDVALRTSDRYFAQARATLTRNVESDVRKEILQMATMIEKFLIQPERATGPKGTLTPANKELSEAGSKLGRVNYFDLQSSNANWPERQLKYMKWKSAKDHGSSWWKNTGDLHTALSNANIYLNNFGPVVVTFQRTKDQSVKNPVKTLPGRQGRTSESFTVGRLEVLTFGKITPDMLPSLASGNVADVTPERGGALANLLPEEVGRKLKGRSSGEFGRAKEYRPVLEPFLSYYLTRAIPNAIYRRTERAFGRDSAQNAALGR